MLVFLGKLCLAFLLILGAAEAVRLLLSALLHTKKSGRVVFVLAFQGHDEEAEFALRGAVQKLKCKLEKERNADDSKDKADAVWGKPVLKEGAVLFLKEGKLLFYRIREEEKQQKITD